MTKDFHMNDLIPPDPSKTISVQAVPPKKGVFLQPILTYDISRVTLTMTHRSNLQMSVRLGIHLALRSDDFPSNEIPNCSLLQSVEC